MKFVEATFELLTFALDPNFCVPLIFSEPKFIFFNILFDKILFLGTKIFCEIFFGVKFLGGRKSVQDGPRNLRLKFGQDWVSNS